MNKENYSLENGHLKINEGIVVIPKNAFNGMNIISVLIPNSVVRIEENAFYNNKIKKLIIPNSVKAIEQSAFKSNELECLELPNDILEIGEYAFSNNKLRYVKIPDGITKIKKAVFYNNNLKEVKLHNNIIEIGEYAFFQNEITNLEIPININLIEKKAFLCEFTYKDLNFTKEDIEKYDFSLILKYALLKEKFSHIEVKINYFEKEVLSNIPLEEESLKSYINNHVKYKKMKSKLTLKNFEDEVDFYKFCYILGIFNTGGILQDSLDDFIINFYNMEQKDYIHSILTSVKLNKYYPKFMSLVVNSYTTKEFVKIGNKISSIYNNFPLIHKIITKEKEDKISKLNSTLLNLKKNNQNTLETEENLRRLKSAKRNINTEDIINYFKKNSFVIREGNEELKDIFHILIQYISAQEEFDVIQDIYEEAIRLDNSHIFEPISDKQKNGVHYYWSSGINPNNLILGYIVDCCAKLNGAGQEIMHLSMTNPCVRNLIIYNSFNNIIGKATAYYNIDKKYILFNNIEMKHSFIRSSKTTNSDKNNVLNTILRGIKEQVKIMNKKGLFVNEVRIGMARNDLESQIQAKFKIVRENLLPNISFGDYVSDASNCQAIIESRVK